MRLHAITWGSGELPVLLLHGFAGTSRSFDGLRRVLEPSVRAVAVDLPGHGQSPLPAAAGSEGYRQTLRALEEVLVAQAGPVALVGYSQGARLALALAAASPALVSHLVLESGSPGIREERARAERQRADELLARRLESEGLESFLDDWEQNPLFEGLRQLPEPQRRELRARRRASSALGLAAALRAYGTGVQPSYWERLSSLRVPTLLLTGKSDLKFSAIAALMSAQLPLAWRCTFDGVWHAPHLENPVPVAEEVLRFIRARWPAALEPDDENTEVSA